MRILVVMSYDQSFWVAPVQVFEQQPECDLLCRGTRVGGLTADVEPSLVADAVIAEGRFFCYNERTVPVLRLKHLFDGFVSKILETDGLRAVVQYDIVGVRYAGLHKRIHLYASQL